MSFNFLPYEQDQLFLMPPSVREWIREETLVRFLSDIVDALAARGRLDRFYARYRDDGWGAPAYHPVMMVKVLLYAYSNGVVSSRKIAQALEMDVGFRYLAANQRPDFRTVNAFRTEHMEALQGLFTEVLELAKQMKLVKLGRVALDGTKIQGNAALARNRTRAQLEAAVQEMLTLAESADRNEDAQLGPDVRGDELPEGVRTTRGSQAAIEAALAELDAKRGEKRREQQELVDERKSRRGLCRGRKPKDPEQVDLPVGTTANLTDPESQTLSSRRGWVQGYNGQAIVDCESQMIVAQQITQDHNDLKQLIPMLALCEKQAGGRPEMLLADKGYWSAANMDAEGSTTLLIALPSRARNVVSPPSPQRALMEQRMEVEENRRIYAQRKCVVEPVFGQHGSRGLRSFVLRGKAKVALEWSLWCTTHNLLKLWRAHTRQLALAA